MPDSVRTSGMELSLEEIGEKETSSPQELAFGASDKTSF